MGEEEVCSERWWLKKLDQGGEVKGESKIMTVKHCIQPVFKRTNNHERYANMLELALGNLQVKVVLLCSTFCEEVEYEEDITKRETALVKKFFLIWGNRKSNKETKKQRRTSCPLLG